MYKVFLGIGGNLGNKQENFDKAHKLINDKIGNVLIYSSIYETPPWGFQSDYPFWNQVIIVETTLDTYEVLEKILQIENQFDRKRDKERYSSRKMDVDILYFEDIFLETNELIIPHPRIQERKFVLVPLVEIAPDFKHPLLRLTSLEMLKNCKDESIIMKIDFDNF